jgi:hypothetical protein
MAVDWPGLRVVWAMGSLGTTSLYCRGAVRASWKRRISLVASFIFRPFVRNLFLHCAQCVKAGSWSYPRGTSVRSRHD